jgi:hypothetical protein
MTGHEQCASAAAVAGLAREVEALRGAVEPLRAVPAQVDELARVVQALAEQTAAAVGAAGGGVPSWLDAPADPGTVRSVLEDLITWMREVYLCYADAAAHLPECWLWHPDVVEELLWLMYTWLAAYRDENATAAKAGDWHDRYRPGVVRRIKVVAGTCSLENHQPRGTRCGGPVVPIAEAMAPIADWWATHRADTPPEPSEDQLAVAAAVTRRSSSRRR